MELKDRFHSVNVIKEVEIVCSPTPKETVLTCGTGGGIIHK